MPPLSTRTVRARALEVGFDLCGVARAERHPRLARLADWIHQGLAGEMTYLRGSLDDRLDPARVLPTVRSIVSVAAVYNTTAPLSASVSDPERVAIARYAWGDDYHDVLKTRLRALLAWMAGEAGKGFEALTMADNGPVQERVFAEQAGLGWIGKNTCLINPQLGSWIFLGEILTNLDLEPDDPGVDQCGTCVRCLEACPTGAIPAPYVVDATKCLSYATIELRGDVPEQLRRAVGPQIFGCDICQDVCPWNRRAAVSDDAAWQPRDGLAHPKLIDLCQRSDEDWRGVIEDSALRRAGLRRLRRSLAYAAARRPRAQALAALDALSSHATAGDPLVAEAIRWARARAEADDQAQAGT
jgi:epoxyqueuosine reductase